MHGEMCGMGHSWGCMGHACMGACVHGACVCACVYMCGGHACIGGSVLGGGMCAWGHAWRGSLDVINISKTRKIISWNAYLFILLYLRIHGSIYNFSLAEIIFYLGGGVGFGGGTKANLLV